MQWPEIPCEGRSEPLPSLYEALGPLHPDSSLPLLPQGLLVRRRAPGDPTLTPGRATLEMEGIAGTYWGRLVASSGKVSFVPEGLHPGGGLCLAAGSVRPFQVPAGAECVARGGSA